MIINFMDQLRFLLTKAGGKSLAIPNHLILEIVTLSDFTFVPCTPSYIRGLFLVKNEIATAIDMGLLLGDKPAEGNMVVVMKRDQELVGFIFDWIGKIVSINADELMVGSQGEQGFKWEGESYWIVDPVEILGGKLSEEATVG